MNPEIMAVDGSGQATDLPGDGRTVAALAFRNDAALASAYDGAEISIWDMATMSLAATLPARPGKVDGTGLVRSGPDAAGGSDNTIRLWEPTLGGKSSGSPGIQGRFPRWFSTEATTTHFRELRHNGASLGDGPVMGVC